MKNDASDNSQQSQVKLHFIFVGRKSWQALKTDLLPAIMLFEAVGYSPNSFRRIDCKLLGFVPPVMPVAMGKSTRGVELMSVDDIDKRQIAAWMTQITAVPGVGGRKK